MLLETLESRRMMSVSLNTTTGLLTVMGKNDANPANGDVITASVSGTTLQVNDNGAAHSFAVSKVKKIAVYARAGDDKVTIGTTVKIPTLLDSGSSTLGGETLKGGSGPDIIILRGNFSFAFGGAGHDNVQNFGSGNRLYGEAGHDTLLSKRTTTSDSRYDGGIGVDTMDYSMATINMLLRNGQSGQYVPGTSPLVISGASFPDGIYGMENLFSGSGNDYIFGDASNNALKGNAGKDQLHGGDGNDTLYGGTGEDALFGENGLDLFFADDGFKDFVSGGAGSDVARCDAIDILNSVEVKFLAP